MSSLPLSMYGDEGHGGGERLQPQEKGCPLGSEQASRKNKTESLNVLEGQNSINHWTSFRPVAPLIWPLCWLSLILSQVRPCLRMPLVQYEQPALRLSLSFPRHAKRLGWAHLNEYRGGWILKLTSSAGESCLSSPYSSTGDSLLH